MVLPHPKPSGSGGVTNLEVRDYQASAISSVLEAWASGTRKVLVLMPTGTGKSLVMAEIVKNVEDGRGLILVLCHREILGNQLESILGAITGQIVGIERGRSSAVGDMSRIVVASVQTLSRDNRLARYGSQDVSHIIIDEAHHALSGSYRKIIDYFQGAYVLGVTATADRGDRRNLGEVFDEVVFEYLLRDSIQDGWNCPIVSENIPLSIDINDVKMQSGDFSDSDLDSVITPYLEGVGDRLQELCQDRKTIIFLPLIKTSRHMNQIMQDRGFKSTHVDGSMQYKNLTVELFREDVYNVVCNSMLLIEGFDDPQTDCIVVLRPTKSRALYAQMVGRGTRIAEGKDFLLLPDFLWHSDKHRLCHPFSLLSSEEIEAEMLSIQQRKGRANIFDIESEAKEESSRQKELQLARFLHQTRNRPRRTMDPVEYGLLVRGRGVQSYGETGASQRQLQPITETQSKFLERNGVNPDGLTSGYADEIIQSIVERATGGLATPKQVRVLKRFGYTDLDTVTKSHASKRIEEIANNGWKR